MKILAIDTSTQSCSAAVVEAGSVLAEITIAGRRSHTRHLMEVIDTVLRLAGCNLTDLDGFAVTRGPGSFTGIRIGISCVKGLAMSTQKPVVGVSSLDALAHSVGESGNHICTLIDARKNEVYWARYRIENGLPAPEISERVSNLEEALSGIRERHVFVGSGALIHEQEIRQCLDGFACFVPGHRHMIHAPDVAALSMDRFTRGETDDINSLIPHYIRKSDAELNFKPCHMNG